jgi:beta-aspartyl-peptidase (threonine type)
LTFIVVAHGGAASKQRDRDGAERAARVGLRALASGGTPLGAAVAATVDLEDDPRFNAGTGSSFRFDGKTVEMDAACMDSDGRFGAVAAIRDVKNPVLVARRVLDTPHLLLVGEGATAYARRLGFPPHDVRTERARKKFAELRDHVRARSESPEESEWDAPTLARHWNFEEPLSEVLGGSDTVGAVATDGKRYAAASSTGGTMAALLGRVGDTPLPGCGIHAGPSGAVAVTGNGDHLARVLLASRVYGWLEDGVGPGDVLDKAYALFPAHVDVGIILIEGSRVAGGSNREMAWGRATMEDAR